MGHVRPEKLDAASPLPGRRPILHDMIGRKLRLHYEEAQRHPLPARLTALLDILDQMAEDPASSRRR
jgi:hypothetical protein